jgi:hypothetical protein
MNKFLPLLLLAPIAAAQAQLTNFESAQSRPICLSPDGTKLFAVNTPDGRVSVFRHFQRCQPGAGADSRGARGPRAGVGDALSNDEAWVVSEVGDSVSVVSVTQGITTATLATKDEPGDVVFASGKALCPARGTIPFACSMRRRGPRAGPLRSRGCIRARWREQRWNEDLRGGKIFGQTKPRCSRRRSPPPQPPPTNGALPTPPQVGLIVASN